MSAMRIAFFGDGLWAARCLERVLQEGHEVVAVVTRRQPADDSLAAVARRKSLPLRCPERANAEEFVAWVRSLALDLGVSMSYDQIFRRPLRDAARLGFINCHAGKLPLYRGRNVINWALINDEREIGLTVHYIDDGIDTGDIILQETLPLALDDTYASVLARTQEAFPGLLAKALAVLGRGAAPRRPQAHIEGTYFPARRPGDEWIDWSDTSLGIYNKIRAITHPGPGARTLLGDRVLIVWRARYNAEALRYAATPGEVVGVLPDRGVKVKTGDTTLLLERVQFEGREETEQVPQFRIGARFGVNLVQAVRELQCQVSELRQRVKDRAVVSAGGGEDERDD